VSNVSITRGINGGISNNISLAAASAIISGEKEASSASVLAWVNDVDCTTLPVSATVDWATLLAMAASDWVTLLEVDASDWAMSLSFTATVDWVTLLAIAASEWAALLAVDASDCVSLNASVRVALPAASDGVSFPVVDTRAWVTLPTVENTMAAGFLSWSSRMS
jgi:hypothetical protein